MRKISIGLLLIVLCFFTGCATERKNTTTEQMVLKENEYRIYCLNKEETKLTYYIREAEAEEQRELIYELLAFLSEDTGELACQCAIGETVKVQSIKVATERLYLYFDEEYYRLDPVKEVLIRAAIVKTLTQIAGIERITFYVVEERQEDDNAVLLGSMTAEDFIDDTNKDIVGNKTINMTLYFADEQGTNLYAERRQIDVDKKSSREKMVLEQLIMGPKNENLRKVLPEGLTIISAITREGVCYLNMDDTFLTGSVNVVETIPVYAIVNSLTEITGVDEVQILINGETGKVYREAIRFDKPLEAREDLIADPE